MKMDWITETLGENAATESPDVVKYVTDKGYKTPADAIKAGYEAHKLNTKKTEDLRADVEKQFVPTEDWNDDQWKAFNDRTRPKDKTAYAVEIPESVKQYVPQERLDKMLDVMLANGTPAPHAKAILNAYMADQAEQLTALTTESARLKAEDEAALKKEWGGNFKANSELAKRGMTFWAKTVGAKEEDFNGWLKTYGLDTHPFVQKLGKFIGELSNDPKFVGGNGGGPAATTEKTTGQMMVESAVNPTEQQT